MAEWAGITHTAALAATKRLSQYAWLGALQQSTALALRGENERVTG